VREKDKVAADGKGSPAADCFCLLTSPLQGRKGISVERVDSHHFRYDFFKKQYTDPNRGAPLKNRANLIFEIHKVGLVDSTN
jgi:hypothetical protein